MEIRCSAVLFDSDGVLVDSHLDGHQAWLRLATEFDFELNDEVFASLAGIRPVDSVARFVTPELVDEAVARLEDLEVDLATSTIELPGARALLSALGPAHWAIVTSASRRLALARWEGAAIPIPGIVIAAEDVHRGKPDPEPYVAAAAALGIDIQECVVFEDSASGAAAAVAAGATVVAVGNEMWPVPPAARIANLAEVSISIRTNGLTVEFAERRPGTPQ